MATPEEMKKLLAQYETPGGAGAVRARLEALGPELAEIGLAYLECAQNYWDEESNARRIESTRALEELADGERAAVFAALFPPIADSVEAGWQLLKLRPYQAGYFRKAFRAPHDAEYTLTGRVFWVVTLLRAVLPYSYDLEFLTVWAARLSWGTEPVVGVLLAAAVDAGHAETFDALVQIANGEHAVATPARYAITALLCCSKDGGWAVVERLLLAAQRQEGLRQVVLESVDFAHPEAFVRMLRLIVAEKLSRFAAVARAVAVWFGLPIDSEQTKVIDGLVAETLENLRDAEICAARVAGAGGQTLYLALWAAAFADVVPATEKALAIAEEPKFERRYVAVHFLAQLGTVAAVRGLRRALGDADLRVAMKAVEAVPVHRAQLVDVEETFVALRELLPRVPAEVTLPAAIWEWNRLPARPSEIAGKMFAHRGERPISELAPYVPAMDPYGRGALLRALNEVAEKRGELSAEDRDLVLSLLGDASGAVREVAFGLLASATVTPAEAEAMEPLLGRKAADLRRGVIRLLLKQSVADCRKSIARLRAAGGALLVQAAEEMETELAPKSVPAASMADGLGLFDPEQRTKLVAPRNVLVEGFASAGTVGVLESLDALVEKHRETPVQFGEARHQELLGNLRWFSPFGEYPLAAVWREWRTGIDDLELVRAMCVAIFRPGASDPEWVKKTAGELAPVVELQFPELVRNTLEFLVAESCTATMMAFLLDAMETFMERAAKNYKTGEKPHYLYSGWRTSEIVRLDTVVDQVREHRAELFDAAVWERYWALLRWMDEGGPGASRDRPTLEVTMEAHRRGLATDADVYEQLLCGQMSYQRRLLDLPTVTTRKPHKLLADYPVLVGMANRCRERVLEVELQRGDLPTAASAAALSLSAVYGAELAVRLLRLLGDDALARGYSSDNESKSVVLSHLLRVCLPGEGDTPERFAACAAGVSRKRLVDLAMYAPQWAAYVERATGMAGLEEAAFWLHAHTKDAQWTVNEEIRELWFAAVSERTPLKREELLDGAVDVEWFRRLRAPLATKDWRLVLDSAKFAAGGAGHRRAQLFAEAIAGGIGIDALAARVREKRHTDSVRAVGLVPLPGKEAVLERYRLLQEFLRGSRKFGSMRQASEKLAYSMGLANLARSAGYADPQRLSWAMEAEAVADLQAGPVVAEDGGVRGVLTVNGAGEPELAYTRDGKALKALPAGLRKSAELGGLRERKTELAQQSSRMRVSLEEAMIRGDRFAAGEVAELAAHPLLRPMVESLLFAGKDGEVCWYGEVRGAARIAHPVDLLREGRWPERQRECLAAERVQPFKQAFRELYVLTSAEREAGTRSRRYEGQQVNPKQAMALLGKRGWVNVPEEGARKTFHAEGISVWVTFLEGWFTPADVDGLTVQHVVFTGRSDGRAVALDAVEPRIFSEAMRDVDLMVSVAHRGGVDPEATASTVEMRRGLLREMLGLLKIGNVRFGESHAFVDGTLGRYNVHLGSGTVHRQPGGSLCILPVHSQHRGRLFLPFADNDPKTAEVVSKVLLLARDGEIKDPTILEQLR